MNKKKKEDIAYVVMLLASLAGIMLMLWLLLNVLSWHENETERCRAQGGELYSVRCVDVIENY